MKEWNRHHITSGNYIYFLGSDFDTVGRKTSSETTRDGGETWDETSWTYDAASGLNTAKEYADGSRIAYAYTDNGKKTRTTWARGKWKRHAYNDRNLMGGTAYSDGTPSVSYAYADSGKVVSATLSDGTSYAYEYDDHLLNTNETAVIGNDMYSIVRTYDGRWRNLETSVAVTNVRHAATTRLYDLENRICGYALTNAAGRGVSVAFAYDDTYLTNTVYTLPGGSSFAVRLTRESARRNLVTRRDCFFGRQPVYWYSTEYDLGSRPTNATDSVSTAREWLYNRRSELVGATIGTNVYGYAYDTIGNRSWAAANAATNAYTANALNQYATVDATNFVYDADGNLANDGRFAYTYDAENRLVAAYPLVPVAGSLAVENVYDHRHRRVRKVVKRYNGEAWAVAETHTFVCDGNNIILESVVLADGTTHTIEHFWGPDKSGTEQGAGGVGGLLAVSRDGVFYIPCYDHNGNIVCYVSEGGNIVAQYVYNPYGNVIETYGTMAASFNFGFSTKYHDREIGMVSYQRRFYRPGLGRWLNRDPIEEEGGENLYAFCQNNPLSYYDGNGCWAVVDNVVAFVTGVVIGAGLQAVSDLIRGEVSGWETYVGAAVAGGVVAEVLLQAPTATGLSKAIYGGVAAATGNFIKQTCEVFVSKKSNSYDFKNLSIDTAAGASLAMLPFPGIPRLNSGRGSYLSLARRINTQYSNGTISHVATMTTVRSVVGVTTEYGVAYNAIQPKLIETEQMVESKISILYHEIISIHLADRCGNTVDVTYQGELRADE